MNTLQRVGGAAALVWSAIFLWITVSFVVILPAQGFVTLEDFSNPAKGIPYLTGSSFPLIEYFLTLLYALVVALVVLALHERIKDDASGLARFALIAGIAVVTLNLAEGVTGLFGRMTITAAVAQNQATAEAVYLSVTTIHDALLFAGIFALGWWSVSANWAALKSSQLSRGLAYLGLLTGVQAIMAIFFPPLSLPVLHIIWTGWLGLVLLRRDVLTQQIYTSGKT